MEASTVSGQQFMSTAVLYLQTCEMQGNAMETVGPNSLLNTGHHSHRQSGGAGVHDGSLCNITTSFYSSFQKKKTSFYSLQQQIHATELSTKTYSQLMGTT
jgi:hypothetical protein